MSDTLKIALTALAGIIVFVLGQILVKLFIEPIQEQWKLRGKIIHTLSFYSMLDIEKAPAELVKEWSVSVRTLASQLQGSSAIPFYKLLSHLKLVLPRKQVFVIAIFLVEITDSDAAAAERISDLIMKRLNMGGLITASEVEYRKQSFEIKKF